MTIKIGDEDKEQMLATLAEGIGSALIEHDTFPHWPSFALAGFNSQYHLPSEGKNREFMEECVGEMPFVEFLVEKIRLELNDTRDFNGEISRKTLVGSPGYQDAHSVAARVISEFESLPWRYRVTVELPEKQFPVELFENGTIALGELASLNVPDLLFAQTNPLIHENQRRTKRMWGSGLVTSLLLGQPAWKKQSVCFSQNVSGFIGINARETPVKRAEERLESFFGLGLAKRLFSHKVDYSEQKLSLRWVVHELDAAGGSIPLTAVSVNEELSEVLRAVSSFNFHSDYPEASRLPWLQKQLSEIDRALRSKNNEKVLLASKWFFDSFKGSDEALRYVRRMTCLEILLGSSVNTVKSSLSEIMSNRLAYMIGNNYAERDRVIADFKQIYGLRSRILHQGQHRLGYRQAKLTSRLKELCEEAISAECRILIASTDGP